MSRVQDVRASTRCLYLPYDLDRQNSGHEQEGPTKFLTFPLFYHVYFKMSLTLNHQLYGLKEYMTRVERVPGTLPLMSRLGEEPMHLIPRGFGIAGLKAALDRARVWEKAETSAAIFIPKTPPQIRMMFQNRLDRLRREISTLSQFESALTQMQCMQHGACTEYADVLLFNLPYSYPFPCMLCSSWPVSGYKLEFPTTQSFRDFSGYLRSVQEWVKAEELASVKLPASLLKTHRARFDQTTAELARISKNDDPVCHYGLGQDEGTCWFTSVYNGMLFGEASRRILMDRLLDFRQHVLHQSGQAVLDRFDSATFNSSYCPRKYEYWEFFVAIKESLCRGSTLSLRDRIMFNVENPKVNRKLITKMSKPTSVLQWLGIVPRQVTGGDSYNALLMMFKNLQISTDFYDQLNVYDAFINEKPHPISSFKNAIIVTNDLGSRIYRVTWPKHLPLLDSNNHQQNYTLDHVSIYLLDEAQKEAHGVIGCFCRNRPMLFDSNSPTLTMAPCDWLNNESLFSEVARANSTFHSGLILKTVFVRYAIYIADRYCDELPDVPCLGSSGLSKGLVSQNSTYWDPTADIDTDQYFDAPPFPPKGIASGGKKNSHRRLSKMTQSRRKNAIRTRR